MKNIIEFRSVSKKYGQHKALSDVSFSVFEHEFFVIFGPSGAGKTTTLKLIAGLEYANEGNILIDETDVTFEDASKRHVRMAFEKYALYPHLTVFENIASPLKNDGVSYKEIISRVNDRAETLGIGDYLNRLPRELSGGQKQRVSLGRAIVPESKIYLLDEPLAHLDAKIRNELRTEFQNIKSFLSNSTVVYVTPDYLEAMALADRVCVLINGKIVQIDTPAKVYEQPMNIETALLFGYPEINLLEMVVDKNTKHLYNKDIKLGPFSKEASKQLDLYEKDKIFYGLRPNKWEFSQNKEDTNKYIKGEVIGYEIRNFRGVILVNTDASGVLSLSCDQLLQVNIGDEIYLKPNPKEGSFFDIDTRNNLMYYQEK